MINTTKNLLLGIIIIPTPNINPNFLVIVIESTPVLVDAPLTTIVTIFALLDDINNHIDHLLNHVLIVIEAYHTQILIYTKITRTKTLSILLNKLFHHLITRISLNLISPLQLLPLYLYIYMFLNPLKAHLYPLT